MEEVDEVPRNLYYADANQVLKIIMAFSQEDFEPANYRREFNPELVHQIFKHSGIIYGYRNLSIDLYFSAKTAKCLVDIKHTEVLVPGDRNEQTPPDDILGKLSPWLPDGFYTIKNKFLRALDRQNNSSMHGELLGTFETFNTIEHKTYKYAFTYCTAENSRFARFHARFQCLIVWFIDAASQVDLDDPNWMFVYAYEIRNYGDDELEEKYPVGFCAIYKFFHYPDKIRTRISQLFVLPSCQFTGVGTKLLEYTYSAILSLPNVVDITVEDPCDAFTRVRDYIDCRLLVQLECFKYPAIKNGFTANLFREANEHYKINKRQCRRIYDILRICYISIYNNTEDYESFYKDATEFIQKPFIRDKKRIMKKKLDVSLYQTNMYKTTAEVVEQNVTNYLNNIKSASRRLLRKADFL